MKFTLLVCMIALFAVSAHSAELRGFGGPLHASCKLTWTFPNDNCANVTGMIVGQIQAMSGSNCGTSEKCNYVLKSNSNGVIKAVHSTPVKHYKDDLTITAVNWGSNDAHCDLDGFSTSETWYAVLDYGTNYCNLHNLVANGGLKFTESADDSSCTQYSSANCDKY
eukprot:TRINITY_DN3081_c0_g2_i2.p3 TRINITY_DN3081_c0_g2~~TRINITY_DN3081_c0_g2_i2.p3  ORF type:complete len:166 (+),score=58.18 TRINITY_DN3081_c0_g2_i2:889-1386(+)